MKEEIIAISERELGTISTKLKKICEKIELSDSQEK